MKGKLILVRHAESVWNRERRLSGNSQIGLTPEGLQQSVKAAEEIRDKGVPVSIAFCSDQKRAIDTLQIMLKELDLRTIPVLVTKDLRESELGLLNGMKISEIEDKYGKDFVFKLIREFNTKAPAKEGEPEPESLKDMMLRVGGFYEAQIRPQVERGKNALIVAHDGTLRALLSYLGDFDENQSRITQFDNAKPFVYEFE
jgi:2,3-bisphosphoglycerate-dependent phosphoglycerate mutase